MSLPLPWELILLLMLLFIGFIIIVFIAKVLFFFLPAGVIAFVVWLLTGKESWAGIAFLVIAVLSILKR